jgi:hypothetical protein
MKLGNYPKKKNKDWGQRGEMTQTIYAHVNK